MENVKSGGNERAWSRQHVMLILIGVASALIASLITWVVAIFTNYLAKSLSDVQLNSIAIKVVENESFRDLLIAKMNASGLFKGENGKQGLQGPTGAQGIDGPAWVPVVTSFGPFDTKSGMSKVLGNHVFCALNSAGDVHHDQSCRCDVSRPGEVDWVIKVTLHEKRDGFCKCGAICLKGK
ncbi:hypothetical protein [Azohydromonas aeria]|uniref:hypothetical protein n=1 Tax=Azohydromonas aeria TaxID=2590212 RepID=UPI0012FAAF8F|nr:hypothetical protein [Azohydromonas aeria]